MKYLNKYNSVNESGISVYTDVWVIIQYGDYDINEIFLNKNEADLKCIKSNEEFEKNFKSKGKFKVKTLDDAINWIKDAIKDDINFDSFNNDNL